jgi:superoxide dismutase, Fe-Mn family
MATYTLPELQYDYGALEPHLSGQIVELHHSKHHKTYVDGANTSIEKLSAARAAKDWGALVGLEQTLAFNLGGHLLHALYWSNLSPNGGGEPTGELRKAIDDTFDGFANFKDHMTQVVATAQGSAWAILSWEPAGRRLFLQQLYTHQDNHLVGAVPLLCIDAWEHAYYLQYKNVKADYAKAIWNVVNWDDVASRFAAATAGSTVATTS